MSLLRFTNTRGETLDMRSDNVHAERIEGADAPSVRTEMVPIVARPGEGYVRRHVEPRTITITLSLIQTPAQSMWATRRAAARILSPSLGLGVLEYQPLGATAIYAIDASVRRLGGPYERPNYGRTVVQFEAPFPYWRDTVLNEQQIVLSSGSTTTEVLVNAGDVPTWPTVVFEADGTATNPSWGSLSFGSRTSQVGVGGTLIVDHLNFTAELDGVNWIDRITAASKFWALPPGNINVRVSTLSTTVTRTFDFAWFDLYDGI